MSKLFPKRALWLCACCLFAQRATADDATATRALFEHDVARLAAEHNPQLRAALLQADSARWDATGLEAQYTPVIAADASGTQTSTPVLTRSFPSDFRTLLDGTATSKPFIAISASRRADVGVELRKHFLWGTDITLRIAPYVLSTYITPGGFSPFPTGWSSPQYGNILKLSLKQPLLKGSGHAVNEAALRAARVQRDVASHTRDRVASEVLRDALTAYWELWYASNSLKIEEQARAVAVKQRDEAAARVANGSLAPVEALVFETRVATRDEAILNAVRVYRQRELELWQKLGMVGDQGAGAIQAESEPMATLPARDVAERGALTESAELKQLMSSVDLARLKATTAAEPHRTRLDLDAYIQQQILATEPKGEDAWVSKLNAFSAFVGLTLETPVSRDRARAEAAKARLATEIAQQNLREARQRVLAQVGILHDRGLSGEQAIALTERTLEIAKQQLAAEQARYATGSATSLQVLEAEEEVRNAQLRVARLRADFVESVLAIAHYTGDLLGRYVGSSGG